MPICDIKKNLFSSVPLLSFCIPTYNRAHELMLLVRRLLSIQSEDIQVVVLDNASTDDTLEHLAEIKDARLVFQSNISNRGALFNGVNVLLQGTGTYSVLVLDKDYVDPDLVPDFLAFLRSTQPLCGYCEYGLPIGSKPRYFYSGELALRGFAFSCHHPTGYFFRAQALREIDAANRFTDFEFVGHFAFEFIQAELCLNGLAVIFQNPVFSSEVLRLGISAKSHGTNASIEDAFFSPNGRRQIAVNFSSHILTLPIPIDLKRELVLDRFFHGLLTATIGYRGILANPVICEHYHIETRKVGFLELMSIVLAFFRSFIPELKAIKQAAYHPTRLDLMLGSVGRLLRRINRCFNGQVA